ncbi:MAG: efflux RND transporter periplasmic adaptor subunit [Halieaceae bacterium]|nr:efflux RND transporter periplasmic adaptor subunit [Halieaceae bacterium]
MASHARRGHCTLPMLVALLLLAPTLSIAPAWAQQDGGPVSVTLERPTIKDIVEYDEYAGRFEAIKRVDVRARVSGYLESIEFTEGQIVDKGQLLFVIDQRPYRIAVNSAQAALDEASANRDLAAIEARRARELLEKNAIARDEADARQQALIAAVARVRVAQARLADAELNLEYTELRAPFRGRAGEHLVDEGNLVSGGSNGAVLLTTIVKEDPIYFTFEVSEQDYLRYSRLSEEGVRPTSRATPNAVAVRLIDEDSFEHHGVMDFVDNELDATTGTLKGRAVFANPRSFIQPGTFGRLRLQSSGLYEAVLIPDRLVQFDQAKQFVFTVDDKDTVRRVFIEPGPMVDGLRVIRSGIEADTRLAGGNFHRLRAGMQVRVRDDNVGADGEEGGEQAGAVPAS